MGKKQERKKTKKKRGTGESGKKIKKIKYFGSCEKNKCIKK